MSNARHFFKNPAGQRAAFTLVEMLVVLAIIGILVGILLPVIARSKIRAKAGLAKVDCAAIATAFTQYHTDYNHFPVAKGQTANSGGDVTYNPPGGLGGGPSNSDAMIILSALEELGGSKPNPGHSRNISKRRYLDSKMTDSVEKPGMGPDGVFRDPFGNPFVITVDLDGDGQCLDLLYGNPQVSGFPDLPDVGQNGLLKKMFGPGPGYVLPKDVMVWSPGPDKEIGSCPAKQGENLDNILGWQ